MSGLDGLIAEDGRLRSYQKSLLSPASKAIHREYQNEEWNKDLDKKLARFLYLLSGYFTNPNTHYVIEYLVRHYRVHELNVPDLLMCALPFHETEHFPRLVRIMNLRPPYEFLKPLKNRQCVTWPKQSVIELASKNLFFLQLICSRLRNAIHYKAVFPSTVSFHTTILASIAHKAHLTDAMQRELFACLSTGIRATEHTTVQTSSQMLLTLMAHRLPLGPRVLTHNMQQLAASATDVTLVNTLQCMAVLYGKMDRAENEMRLPENVFGPLMNSGVLPTALPHLASQPGAHPFLRAFWTSLAATCLSTAHRHRMALQLIAQCPLQGHSAAFLTRLLQHELTPESKARLGPVLRALAEADPETLDRQLQGVEGAMCMFLRQVFAGTPHCPLALPSAAATGPRCSKKQGAAPSTDTEASKPTTTLALALQSPDSALRLAAVQQLGAVWAQWDAPLVKAALQQRLCDSDSRVVRAALECPGLPHVLHAKSLVTHFASFWAMACVHPEYVPLGVQACAVLREKTLPAGLLPDLARLAVGFRLAAQGTLPLHQAFGQLLAATCAEGAHPVWTMLAHAPQYGTAETPKDTARFNAMVIDHLAQYTWDALAQTPDEFASQRMRLVHFWADTLLHPATTHAFALALHVLLRLAAMANQDAPHAHAWAVEVQGLVFQAVHQRALGLLGETHSAAAEMADHPASFLTWLREGLDPASCAQGKLPSCLASMLLLPGGAWTHYLRRAADSEVRADMELALLAGRTPAPPALAPQMHKTLGKTKRFRLTCPFAPERFYCQLQFDMPLTQAYLVAPDQSPVGAPVHPLSLTLYAALGTVFRFSYVPLLDKTEALAQWFGLWREDNDLAKVLLRSFLSRMDEAGQAVCDQRKDDQLSFSDMALVHLMDPTDPTLPPEVVSRSLALLSAHLSESSAAPLSLLTHSLPLSLLGLASAHPAVQESSHALLVRLAAAFPGESVLRLLSEQFLSLAASIRQDPENLTSMLSEMAKRVRRGNVLPFLAGLASTQLGVVGMLDCQMAPAPWAAARLMQVVAGCEDIPLALLDAVMPALQALLSPPAWALNRDLDALVPRDPQLPTALRACYLITPLGRFAQAAMTALAKLAPRVCVAGNNSKEAQMMWAAVERVLMSNLAHCEGDADEENLSYLCTSALSILAQPDLFKAAPPKHRSPYLSQALLLCAHPHLTVQAQAHRTLLSWPLKPPYLLPYLASACPCKKPAGGQPGTPSHGNLGKRARPSGESWEGHAHASELTDLRVRIDLSPDGKVRTLAVLEHLMRRAEIIKQGEALVAPLCLLLRVLLDSTVDETPQGGVLILKRRSCYDVAEDRSAGVSTSFEYAKQLVLNLLHRLACWLGAHHNTAVRTGAERHFDVTALVEAIRASTSTQTHTLALRVVTALAPLYPARVLQGAIPVLTLMGRARVAAPSVGQASKQEDMHTLRTLQQTIAGIIPPLLAQGLPLCRVLWVFADSWAEIPPHRRLPLFVSIVSACGAPAATLPAAAEPAHCLALGHALAGAALVLFSKQLQPGAESMMLVSFAHSLALQFNPAAQMAMVQCLLAQLHMPADDTFSTTKELFTDATKRESHRLNALATRFLSAHFALPALVAALRTAHESPVLQEQLSRTLHACLSFWHHADRLASQSQRSASKRVWRTIGRDLLSLVEGLVPMLSSEAFLHLAKELVLSPGAVQNGLHEQGCRLCFEKVESLTKAQRKGDENVARWTELASLLASTLAPEQPTATAKAGEEAEHEALSHDASHETSLLALEQLAGWFSGQEAVRAAYLDIAGRVTQSLSRLLARLSGLLQRDRQESAPAVEQPALPLSALRTLVAHLKCLAALSAEMKDALLEHVNAFFPLMVRALELSVDPATRIPSEPAASLRCLVLGSLHTSVEALSQYLFTHLAGLLTALSRRPLVLTAHAQTQTLTRDLLQALTQGFTLRRILPQMRRACDAIAQPDDALRASVLVRLLAAACRHGDTKGASHHATSVWKLLMHVGDTRLRLKDGALPCVRLAEEAVADCYSALVLKLNEVKFRPILQKTIIWALTPIAPNEAPRGVDAQDLLPTFDGLTVDHLARLAPFFAVTARLAADLSVVFVPYQEAFVQYVLVLLSTRSLGQCTQDDEAEADSDSLDEDEDDSSSEDASEPENDNPDSDSDSGDDASSQEDGAEEEEEEELPRQQATKRMRTVPREDESESGEGEEEEESEAQAESESESEEIGGKEQNLQAVQYRVHYATAVEHAFSTIRTCASNDRLGSGRFLDEERATALVRAMVPHIGNSSLASLLPAEAAPEAGEEASAAHAIPMLANETKGAPQQAPATAKATSDKTATPRNHYAIRAIVDLAAASNEAVWKEVSQLALRFAQATHGPPIHTLPLTLTDDAEAPRAWPRAQMAALNVRVRAHAIELLRQMYVRLAAEFLIFLPEQIPVLAELLADGTAEVEQAAHALKAMIEEVAGEPIDRYLE